MELKLYTEQLKSGKREAIELMLPPDFLKIEESDIAFKTPIHLKGEAYAADDHLVLQLSAQTEALMPCGICNEMTLVFLQTEEIYHTILFEDLPSTIFDFSDIVREEIVLLIPQFVECKQGECPERSSVSKYIKSKSVSPTNHFPFADL
jgi:uncharacterized metal-binding protein YceD (DUF177 family)